MYKTRSKAMQRGKMRGTAQPGNQSPLTDGKAFEIPVCLSCKAPMLKSRVRYHKCRKCGNEVQVVSGDVFFGEYKFPVIAALRDEAGFGVSKRGKGDKIIFKIPSSQIFIETEPKYEWTEESVRKETFPLNVKLILYHLPTGINVQKEFPLLRRGQAYKYKEHYKKVCFEALRKLLKLFSQHLQGTKNYPHNKK